MIHPATIYVVGVIFAATLVICVGIIAYARGYRAGVKYCTEALEPLKAELRNSFEGALAPTSELREHVSEQMKRETRH